jgi:response regulator RpfG family c-di-GMP phosphodiesterase
MSAAAVPNLRAPTSKPKILCVDDEPMVLEGLRDVLRRSFDVQVASSGAEGLIMLKKQRREVAVVISDMRMPEMPGSVFLREARRVAPMAVRMLLTGYADSDAAIKAVNDGQIFRFLTKPCDRDELLQACSGAVWQHRLQKTERDLLEQTVQGSVKALTDVLALAAPAVFGQGARLKDIVAALAAETGWNDSWEIEVAALLAQVGAITLPDETAEKLYSGGSLSADEEEMVARVPGVTKQILGNIPRLEGVMQILTHYQRRFDSVKADGMLPVGARMLRVGIDFLALEREDPSPLLALETMRGRNGVYDPDLLEAFARTVGIGDRRIIVVEIPVRDLREGMTLVADARAASGQLLIARGHPVTPELIERLRNFPTGHVREPLRVTQPA